MNILFYQAECGDAARIRFTGNDNKPHNIFIDSGFNRTFRHILDKEIIAIKKFDEIIDFWIISHIHDDHIGGVLSYIQSMRDGELPNLVNSWLYNPPKIDFVDSSSLEQFSISEAKSIRQGSILCQYLRSIGTSINEPITNALNPFDLYGMKITILSPSSKSLDALSEKYTLKTLPIEKIKISDATSICQNDYHIPIESFDLTFWEEDNSIENGSSIAILTELNNRKILWLADSFPSIVASKLKQLGFSKKKPLTCDWIKISHHGSAGNINDELLEIVKCDNFLLSTNGENKHCLPNKECIARIIRNKNRKKSAVINLYFTYDNPTLRNIFKSDGNEVFDKYNFKVFYNNSKKLEIEI